MENKRFKQINFLKMGQKASRSKFIRARGHDVQKKNDPVLNLTKGYPIV